MSTTTLAPPHSAAVQTPLRMCQLLTREQYFALDRLQGLLDRRDAVDSGRLRPPEDQAWLVHALDAAIVSYYRLARMLCLEEHQAEKFLQDYRQSGVGSAEE